MKIVQKRKKSNNKITMKLVQKKKKKKDNETSNKCPKHFHMNLCTLLSTKAVVIR